MPASLTVVPFLLQIATLIGVAVIAWGVLLASRAPGQPLIAPFPRRPIPWGLGDVLIAFTIWQLTLLTAVALFMAEVDARDTVRDAARDTASNQVSHPAFPREVPAQSMLPSAGTLFGANLGGLAAAVLLVVWFMRRGASCADLGFDPSYIRSDVVLGVQAFFLITPLTYLVQSLVSRRWPGSPLHPLIESLLRSDNLALLGNALFAAVIVAPVLEELLFRVILQGWLERLASDWQATGETVRPVAEEVLWGGPSGQVPTVRRTMVPWGVVPILTSAFLFAIAHGTGVVALFVFACGLGYLYQRTHRCIPTMVVHFLLNALTMVQLVIYLAVRQP